MPYLLAASYLAPRIGVGLFLAALITGQLAGGVVLDHFGMLGAATRPIDPIRVVVSSLCSPASSSCADSASGVGGITW